MKVSIITVCFNSERSIYNAMKSVLQQNYSNIEYIVVDGGSKDRTVDIIKDFELLFNARMKWVSERDNGIYDAMNKGIGMATGDIVGILNSDDHFFDKTVIQKIVDAFQEHGLEATIGDIVFVREDNPKNVIRHYSSKKWKPWKFAWGYMPPHPSFFVLREYFCQLGLYKPDYKIAADYELLIRFLLKTNLKWGYLPIITTKMLMGGASTKGIKSLVTLNKEIARACKENDIYTNYFMIYSKYLFKPFEFFRNA